MKTKRIEASGLARVEMHPVEKDCVALVLTDTKQKTTGYLLTPECLSTLLDPLLSLAAKKWAKHPDFVLETVMGFSHEKPVSGFAITPGRIESEVRLRVLVGKTEFAFYVPLDAIIKAMDGFIPEVKKERGH